MNRNRLNSLTLGAVVALTVLGCGMPENTLESAGQANNFASPDPLRQNPELNAKLLSATNKYGQLVVREGTFDKEAKIKPWSAYWYPFSQRDLFEGSPAGSSPLEKFDTWVRNAHHEEANAARFEKEKVFDQHAENWEGRCNAWAIASITRPEPRASKAIDGVEFSANDLKALLIKTYEVTDGLEYHGQVFVANRADSVYDDIFPDQFHRLVQVQLFDRGLPLIFDRDPGPQIWNFPAYKTNIVITKDASDSHVMHVRNQMTVADALHSLQDFQGTQPVTYEYTYDLMGDPQPDGSFKVTWGKWTGRSVDDHPDFVTLVPEGYIRKSRNDAMKIAYVDEILTKAAASPRDSGPAPGAPGAPADNRRGGVLGDLFDRIFGGRR